MSGNHHNEPTSPCVRRCCLDDNDVCLGCFRTREEITSWAGADRGQRLTILNKSTARRRNSAG